MDFFKKYFSQPEVTDSTRPQPNLEFLKNINMKLILKKGFDLDCYLEDFNNKINYLYENMKKMKKKLELRDQEVADLKNLCQSLQQRLDGKTSIGCTEKSKKSFRVRVIFGFSVF